MNTQTKVRDSEFSTTEGIVDLPLTRGAFCIAYISEKGFDSYGCPSPKKFWKISINRKRNCVIWEHKNQKKTNIVLPSDFPMKYLIKKLKLCLRTAVLHLHWTIKLTKKNRERKQCMICRLFQWFTLWAYSLNRQWYIHWLSEEESANKRSVNQIKDTSYILWLAKILAF